MTECITKKLLFQELGRREIVADFDGGTITSDAGALLLREVDLANGFIEGFAGCFTDFRHPGYVEHSVKELVGQRVYGICLGYEDVANPIESARAERRRSSHILSREHAWSTNR